jgi:hypothetical protein
MKTIAAIQDLRPTRKEGLIQRFKQMLVEDNERINR